MQLDTLGMDVFWSRYDGASWSPPLNVSKQHYQNNDMFCSMALDTLGHPHVVWRGGGTWFSYHDGSSWSIPELFMPSSWYLSLASDKRNRLHLAYRGGFYYRSRENGIWEPEEQVVLLADYPSIAVDTLFRPQACWVGVSDSGGDIYYNYRDSVSGWSAPVRLSYTRGASRYPSLSEDRWGRKYVVWCDWPDNRDSMLYYGNLWWGRYDGIQWRVDSLRFDSLKMDWEPSVGFPVSDSGVDVVWTQGPLSGPYRVMYWRLPLLPNGVEGGRPVEPRGEGLQFSVRSPVRSQLVVRYFLPQSKIQNLKSKISLYDLSGRLVGELDEGPKPYGWHECKVPLNLPSGVYFLRLEAGKSSLTRKFVLLR
jgi:hypothetical protein